MRGPLPSAGSRLYGLLDFIEHFGPFLTQKSFLLTPSRTIPAPRGGTLDSWLDVIPPL